MYRQAFTIHGQPYGGGLREEVFVRGELQTPWSTAFFCPHCGEIWAKATIPGARFRVYTHPCEKHPSQTPVWVNEVPGSVFLTHDRDYEDSLPEEVWRRELDLAFEHILRNGE